MLRIAGETLFGVDLSDDSSEVSGSLDRGNEHRLLRSLGSAQRTQAQACVQAAYL